MSEDDKVEIQNINIKDVTPDTMNTNAHNERGNYMLNTSYDKFGNRGAIVLDKNKKISAGNGRHETAGQNGIDEVVLIKADPNKLYALQYDDFDMDDSANPAREFSVADNRTAQVGIEFDPAMLLHGIGEGLEYDDWFTEKEMEGLLDGLELEIDFGVAGQGESNYEDNDAPAPSISHVKMVQLFLTVATFPDFERKIDALNAHFGTENTTDCVLEAIKYAFNSIG